MTVSFEFNFGEPHIFTSGEIQVTWTMADSVQIHFYVPKEQKERWEEYAEKYGTTLSGHIRDMVEAGMKDFEPYVEPRESVSELREQRNALRRDLDSARDRIERLEDRLDRGERAAIVEYVEQNPGCDYDDLLSYLSKTVGQRLTWQLQDLEGDVLSVDENETYYYFGDE